MKLAILIAATMAFLIPSCGSVTDPTFMNNASASMHGGFVTHSDGSASFVEKRDPVTSHPFFGSNEKK